MKYQTTELEHATSNPSNPDVPGDDTEAEMSSQNSPFKDGMDVYSILLSTPQSAAIPGIKDQGDIF
jgi:hypothetical protein